MDFQLPDHSRVWVYQADRPLSTTEKRFVSEQSEAFIRGWSAHGAELMAEIKLVYDQFLIIAVDEKVAQATGCSIDKSVHFVQDLGKELALDFFNRLNIAFKKGEHIVSLPIHQFEAELKSGNLNENTPVFNNLVSNLGELRNNWESTVKNSWHSQLLAKV